MKISINNYEEWMIDHLEGNLSPAQEVLFQKFLNDHPDLKNEMDVFRSTILIPDLEIVHPNKESLKKRETKVIGMRPYFKYITAIAAASLLFIAIRFIIVQNTTTSGKGYSAEIEKPVLDKKSTTVSDTLIEVEKISTSPDIYFVDRNNNEDKKVNEKKASDPLELYKRELAETEEVLFAQSQSITYKYPKARLKVTDFKEQYAEIYKYHFDNMMKETKEQPSIVDRINSTMAFASDVGNMIGISKSPKDETSIDASEEKVKTTSIKILDLEFYNRRKVNQ